MQKERAAISRNAATSSHVSNAVSGHQKPKISMTTPYTGVVELSNGSELGKSSSEKVWFDVIGLSI
jgi:hypothetical protein